VGVELPSHGLTPILYDNINTIRMKRFFSIFSCLLLLLLGGLNIANAEPVMTVTMDDTHLVPGNEYVLSLNLKNDDKVSGMIQADITLPEGLEWLSTSKMDLFKPTARCSSDAFVMSSYIKLRGSMEFVMPFGSIEAGSGTFATITVKCTDALAKKSKIKLTNVKVNGSTALADDSITVKNASLLPNLLLTIDPDPVAIVPGAIKKLAVNLENEQLYYKGEKDAINNLQFDVVMPDGTALLTYDDADDAIELNSARLARSHGVTVVKQREEKNTYRVMMTSMVLGTIKGNSGTLFWLKMKATDELADKSAFKVTHEVFSSKGGVAYNPEINSERLDEDIANMHNNFEVPIIKVGSVIDENADNDFSTIDGQKLDVSLTRTFKKDGWNSLVLPFALTSAEVEAAFGTDAKVAYFTNDQANTIELNTTSTKDIAANTPVLVKTTTDVKNPIFTGRTIVAPVADGPVVSGAKGINFVGSYAGSVTLTTDDYFVAGTNLWRSAGKTTMAATRAYFKDTSASAKSKNIRLVIDGNENVVTAIDGVAVSGSSAKGAVYSLTGQKVADSLKTSPQIPAGLYIVNGKKVIIK